MHMVEAHVGAHKLLDIIIGEGVESISFVELLQVEQICDKLSRMCVAHITATRKSNTRALCCMVDRDHLYVIYERYFLVLVLILTILYVSF